MNKNVALLSVFAVAIVASALLLGVLFQSKDALFWVSLAFLEFSLALCAVLTVFLMGDSRYSFPFDISIVTVSCLYIVLVAAIDVLFGWIFRLPLGAYLCMHLITLMAFLIIGVLLMAQRQSISRQNKAARAASCEQQLLLGEAERLRFLVHKLPPMVSREAERELSGLHDAIRFSNLMPNRPATDIDNRIRAKVFSLAYEIDNLVDIESDDISAIRSAVHEIRQLLEIRNLQIKSDQLEI